MKRTLPFTSAIGQLDTEMKIWEHGKRLPRAPMEITKAKEFENQNVQLSWTDRKGHLVSEAVFVYEVNFVPFYGPCFLTSHGDIRLDRVVGCFASQLKSA